MLMAQEVNFSIARPPPKGGATCQNLVPPELARTLPAPLSRLPQIIGHGVEEFPQLAELCGFPA